MLTCTCHDIDEYPGSWWYYIPKDFIKLDTKRRRRCSSCKSLIDLGAECLKFDRARNPYNDIEWNICGDEIDISPLFMCESCGEIYLNLHDIGYCIDITENMNSLLSEYHKLTGFKS